MGILTLHIAILPNIEFCGHSFECKGPGRASDFSHNQLSLLQLLPHLIEGTLLDITNLSQHVSVKHQSLQLAVLVALAKDLVASLVVLEKLDHECVKPDFEVVLEEKLLQSRQHL